MIDAVKLSEPKREVILLLKKELLARAAQDQTSQRIRPQARGSVLLNLPTRLKARARASIRDLMKNQKAKVDGSMGLERANLRKAKKGDAEKGTSKKGSSKGSTEKGKSKGKHYSKGKGQK